jgi:hypothetical protein
VSSYRGLAQYFMHYTRKIFTDRTSASLGYITLKFGGGGTVSDFVASLAIAIEDSDSDSDRG